MIKINMLKYKSDKGQQYDGYTENSYTQAINDSFINPCIEKLHVFLAIIENMSYLQETNK